MKIGFIPRGDDVNEKQGGNVRAHVWVKGRVQGVGFRDFVEQIGAQLGLTGWVRNVGRDTVEAVAEGERAGVEQFIEMLKRGPRSARVEDTRVEWEPVAGEFESFDVHHSL